MTRHSLGFLMGFGAFSCSTISKSGSFMILSAFSLGSDMIRCPVGVSVGFGASSCSTISKSVSFTILSTFSFGSLDMIRHSVGVSVGFGAFSCLIISTSRSFMILEISWPGTTLSFVCGAKFLFISLLRFASDLVLGSLRVCCLSTMKGWESCGIVFVKFWFPSFTMLELSLFIVSLVFGDFFWNSEIRVLFALSRFV